MQYHPIVNRSMIISLSINFIINHSHRPILIESYEACYENADRFWKYIIWKPSTACMFNVIVQIDAPAQLASLPAGLLHDRLPDATATGPDRSFHWQTMLNIIVCYKILILIIHHLEDPFSAYFFFSKLCLLHRRRQSPSLEGLLLNSVEHIFVVWIQNKDTVVWVIRTSPIDYVTDEHLMNMQWFVEFRKFIHWTFRKDDATRRD